MSPLASLNINSDIQGLTPFKIPVSNISEIFYAVKLIQDETTCLPKGPSTRPHAGT